MIKFLQRLFVNGKSHEVTGRNVTVVNRKIYVDGKLVTEIPIDEAEKTVHIAWEGSLANLDCLSCEVSGDVQGNVDCTTANIRGNVGGYVEANTVNCGNVGGDVESNTVNCGDVGGDIDATTVTCKSIDGSVDAVNVKVN